jgi:hypothetical protein
MMVHVSLTFMTELNEFPLVPCLAGNKKLDDSSHLNVEIACVA